MNTVLYNKETKVIIEVLEADAEFNGLNPELAYGKFTGAEGKEKITDEGIVEILPTETKLIIKSIFAEIESDQALVIKLMKVIDKYPSFLTALDTENWPLARLKLNEAQLAEDITEDEVLLISAKIPE